MKRLFIILSTIFFGSLCFAQDLPDTIITKDADTIICKITFKNDNNIFYDYRPKKSIKSDYIEMASVAKCTAFGNEAAEIAAEKADDIIHLIDIDKSIYFITNDNDTIYNQTYHLNEDTTVYNKIDFMKGGESIICGIYYNTQDNKTTYWPYQVKELTINENKYISFSASAKDYSSAKDKATYTFAKIIEEGNITFVEFWNTGSCNSASSNFKSKLNYALVNKDLTSVINAKNFVSVARFYFKDNLTIKNKIVNKEYSFDDLKMITREYNKGN